MIFFISLEKFIKPYADSITMICSDSGNFILDEIKMKCFNYKNIEISHRDKILKEK